MPTSRRQKTLKSSPTLRSSSWLALLAATTLGDSANTVRAEVRADGGLVESRDYRLVVHSYDGENGLAAGERPVGSYQRAVTAAEMRNGVRVSLLELRKTSPETRGAVVAWIEAGKPDLEFDGRMARPRAGSLVGLARRTVGDAAVQIRLSRSAA
jgi:hypothetical protein